MNGYTHTHTLIILSHKKMKICDNMDGPGGYNVQWNKTEENTVWFHLHVESEKNKTNNYNETETDSQIQRTN